MTAKLPRIGRYQPEVLLGRGRVTETYRARLVEVLPGEKAETFSLKVLRPGEQRAEVELRFIAAARMLQRRPTLGTAGVFEIGDRLDGTFAAFKFEEGVNLRQLRAHAVPEGRMMDPRLVGTLGRKLAERLVPLHGQPDGVRVHGGLSPGNVLVRPNGELVLLDCGFGEALRSAAGWPSESWRFAAPEQLRGEPASPVSDLFSLGGLMYFLYVGRAPFVAESPPELEAQIAAGPPDLAELHPAMAAGLTRLLAHSPEARPRSALEVVRQISAALLSINAQVGAGVPAAPAPAAVPPAARAIPVASSSVDSPGDPAEAYATSGSDGAEPGEGEGTVQPFVFAPDEGGADVDGEDVPAGGISADDPEVGVVYDDDDDDELEVSADGKVRRRRRRGVRLLAWTKSALARKLFRYAWVPIAVLAVVGGMQGFFLLKSWRTAREQVMLRDAALAAERARLEAAKPKLVKAPTLPKGHLAIKVSPSGAVVWIDGQELGTSPSTMITVPGAHKVVVTAPGYRMVRDVIDTTNGAVFEREMVPAIFPLTGSVGVNVSCKTEGKYPVLVDGKEIGAMCPIAGIRLDPGRHMVGIFVIPENRIWSQEREIVAERPHRVQFNY